MFSCTTVNQYFKDLKSLHEIAVILLPVIINIFCWGSSITKNRSEKPSTYIPISYYSVLQLVIHILLTHHAEFHNYGFVMKLGRVFFFNSSPNYFIHNISIHSKTGITRVFILSFLI